jgi:hypothetical protein
MSLGELFVSIRERSRSIRQSHKRASHPNNSEITDSLPATDDLVDFQCHDCSFRAEGTYADVEIAARAHRHPDSSSLPMDDAERERLRKKYFEESLAPLLADTASLPQPYPRFYIWGGTLVALIATAGGALLSRWLVDTWYPSMGGWIHGSFMLLVVGGLLYTLLRYENDRRGANIHRLRIVAECNHQIRNALQVLIWNHGGHPSESLGISRQIADAVHRIELTLSEIFPRVL